MKNRGRACSAWDDEEDWEHEEEEVRVPGAKLESTAGPARHKS
jgi:hypothetical protein